MNLVSREGDNNLEKNILEKFFGTFCIWSAGWVIIIWRKIFLGLFCIWPAGRVINNLEKNIFENILGDFFIWSAGWVMG